MKPLIPSDAAPTPVTSAAVPEQEEQSLHDGILIRLRELAIQAGSDTVGDKERGYINNEAQTLIQEVDRIANVTNFNGTPLLNGKSSKDVLEFQVGTRNDESDDHR